MSVTITSVKARQIFDSRGNPTVEVDVETSNGVRAAVPSGASTGIYEALELRDGVPITLDPIEETAIDNFMVQQLDGTQNEWGWGKQKLGANAILAVSLAVCKAGAEVKNIPLYMCEGFLLWLSNHTLLTLLATISCSSSSCFQCHQRRFTCRKQTCYAGASSFKEAMKMGVEVYHHLKAVIKKKYGQDATNVGDEGGFAPNIQENKEGLELLKTAIAKAGYTGKDKTYDLNFKEENNDGSQKISGDALKDLYKSFVSEYPIVSIEDPFDQDDWEHYSKLTKEIGEKVQIVGDDLLVTNPKRVEKATNEKTCKALLLKVNQIGSVTESIEAVKMSKKAGWGVMASHRSGETEDTFIADLSVGLATGQIKTGAPCRSERLAKYNQLLRIEELGAEAVHAGASFRAPLDDDEPTEKIVSTSQYSKFDLGQYPDFDLGQYSDFDDVSEEETDPTCNDFDIGQYPNFDDETAAAEEDVVDDNEEEVTTVNEHVEHPFCNSYNPEKEKEEEEISEENATGEDLKIALYTKCVEDGYQLKVNKSSKDRFKTRVYRGHEIMTDMNTRFKISISYSQAWRAKCYALELMRGSPEALFAQMSAYCHNLKLKNPGSVTHIKTDRDGRFELMFIAIGVAIRSFITCMRPVIIVDRAHLKGRYLGVNLLAVVMDANNGIFPIAYRVGKSETFDSWTWFMGHLRDCIGLISNLTIIFNRANSIDNAVRRCFPDAFHGLCGVHLYRNLKSRSAGTLEHRVTPWTEKKITKRVVKSTSWRVEPCSNTLFEVLNNNLNGLVDLNAKTCSCMKWQTSGYPCGHVIKVALHLNQDDSSAYAMDCYTTEVYRQTYAEIIYPIPHPSEWDIPDDLQTVLPPAMDRRLPGRPKSHDRIPSKGEEKKRSTCSRCKESCHTRLTCGSPVPS
ncbi:Enolase 2 [Hibiscus syriacus]|uniref:phosphopyruvate hydratase n=2 Tax=Magnoliopsida TaxID=3398 RepID=A0A6A3BVK7_HIBSY|nr:Enolase 2 [Hibiscus syriacus]